MRLQAKLQIRAEPGQIGLGQLWLGGLVERLDFGPLQAHHVNGDLRNAFHKLRVRAQPGFQTRSEIAKGERARRTILEVGNRQLFKGAIADDESEPFEVFG